MEYNFVVHGSTVNRMGVADQRGVAGILGPGIEQGFQAAGRAVEEERTHDGGWEGHSSDYMEESNYAEVTVEK